MTRISTGNFGESLACDYLKSKGYKILERNFRIRGGEIDIVAKDTNGDIVFVEVKTRYSHEFGSPLESITPWKINFLIRAANFYLVKHNLIQKPFRLDAVTVDMTENKRIEHIKNITL